MQVDARANFPKQYHYCVHHFYYSTSARQELRLVALNSFRFKFHARIDTCRNHSVLCNLICIMFASIFPHLHA